MLVKSANNGSLGVYGVARRYCMILSKLNEEIDEIEKLTEEFVSRCDKLTYNIGVLEGRIDTFAKEVEEIKQRVEVLDGTKM
jgi:hypothetical protein